MIELEEIKAGMNVEGFEPGLVVTVFAVTPIGDNSLQVYYKLPDGTIRERLITRGNENDIRVATVSRPWAFDGDGEAFKLTVEAKRIDLAFLFDPMTAVHTSNVEPLPHQITAVYESMLPRQPLRFVLADDPGAGKTIMAGLYIRELIMRADANRVLVVAPGSLTEQWRDELFEKFGLEFKVFSRDLESSTPSGNPFDDAEHIIARLDQLSRDENLQDKACAVDWDLVIFDEAHKLSAHFLGKDKTKETKRFILARRLGLVTRNLLLMTATPHNGKEEDFQLFLSLIDADRFFGKFRDGVHKADVSDLMRRMVKEELLRFDGCPLFPQRYAHTVNYKLSDLESDLYENVTNYVKTEMGKADALDGRRKGSVGFALTTLQRRLASSPEAIYQSLKRRHERLEQRLQDIKIGRRPSRPAEDVWDGIDEEDDDLNALEQEDLEELLVDDASASTTTGELEGEILVLQALMQKARNLLNSEKDKKWEELSLILQNNPGMRNSDGRMRKLIIFSEHRDTLNYLKNKIIGVVGNPNAVVAIHGGVQRDERRRIQEMFRADPEVRVLIATDAAGEGVNLQSANLMVNYDLPWNPNRLEQRFGRIHRIGQTEVCHLWNLVAGETREGNVYYRLLEKLQIESEAMQGRVFDILGDLFEGNSLRDLLIDAIRYGDQPDVRAYIHTRLEGALDREHLKKILDRNALAQETMSIERLFAVKEEMEKAEARRLQPFFVKSYFLRAFDFLKGTIHSREADRFEINHVPAAIRERDRSLSAKKRASSPVVSRYERVCFTKEAVRLVDKPGAAMAVLLHPGHPLMKAVSDIILEKHANLLRQGTVLVDPTDEGEEASLLFLLTHEILCGDNNVLSKRLQFVRVFSDGRVNFAGWAPHLDLAPLASEDRPFIASLLDEPWISVDTEKKAVAFAAYSLVPEHLEEVKARRIAQVKKTLTAVHERLTKEIDYHTDIWIKLRDGDRTGKDVPMRLEKARRTVQDLEERLENRKKELNAMMHVYPATPVVLGGSLIIPHGLLKKLKGQGDKKSSAQVSADAAARRRIEQLAMEAVRKTEEARGRRTVDVSAEKCGWDLTSYPPAEQGIAADPLHIEVKGRAKGADTVTVTRNEIMYALNQSDKFVLALVLVGEDDSVEGPYYIKNFFDTEPGWGVSSWNIKIDALLQRAEVVS